MKLIAVIVVVTAAVVLLPLGSTMSRYHYGPADAALHLLYNDPAATVYASGFSESRFSQVQPGMSRAEVEGLLGPPLRRWHRDFVDCAWSYSWQRRGDDSFDLRNVIFNRDGTVHVAFREFYVD